MKRRKGWAPRTIMVAVALTKWRPHVRNAQRRDCPLPVTQEPESVSRRWKHGPRVGTTLDDLSKARRAVIRVVQQKGAVEVAWRRR